MPKGTQALQGAIIAVLEKEKKGYPFSSLYEILNENSLANGEFHLHDVVSNKRRLDDALSSLVNDSDVFILNDKYVLSEIQSIQRIHYLQKLILETLERVPMSILELKGFLHGSWFDEHNKKGSESFFIEAISKLHFAGQVSLNGSLSNCKTMLTKSC